MKILVTFFEPFAGNSLNSSCEVAKLLPDNIDGSLIVKEMLPVNFMSAGEKLNSLIELHLPDVVLSLGQSRACCLKPYGFGKARQRWVCSRKRANTFRWRYSLYDNISRQASGRCLQSERHCSQCVKFGRYIRLQPRLL